MITAWEWARKRAALRVDLLRASAAGPTFLVALTDEFITAYQAGQAAEAGGERPKIDRVLSDLLRFWLRVWRRALTATAILILISAFGWAIVQAARYLWRAFQ